MYKKPTYTFLSKIIPFRVSVIRRRGRIERLDWGWRLCRDINEFHARLDLHSQRKVCMTSKLHDMQCATVYLEASYNVGLEENAHSSQCRGRNSWHE